MADGREKFQEFLNLENRGFGYITKNKNIIDFLSYILCRKIGGLIENIIRNRFDGTLKALAHPIPADQIEKEG